MNGLVILIIDDAVRFGTYGSMAVADIVLRYQGGGAYEVVKDRAGASGKIVKSEDLEEWVLAKKMQMWE